MFGSPQERGSRTASEREEARKERERRRAERRGEPLPSEPDAVDGDPAFTADGTLEADAGADEASAFEGASDDGAYGRSDSPGVDVSAVEVRSDADAVDGATFEMDAPDGPAPAALDEPIAVDPEEAAEAEPEPETREPEPELHEPEPELHESEQETYAPEPEAGASPQRRTPQQRLPAKVAGRSRADAQRRAATRGPARNGKLGGRSKKATASGLRVGQGKAQRPRTRRALIARSGAVGSLLLVGVLTWLLVSIFQPFHGAGHGKVVVVIPKNTSVGGVGNILAKHGVVSSGFFFEVRTLIDGTGGELQAGRYVLKHDMSYSEAIAALTGQVPHVAVTKVVIPEGETRRQIAQIAKKDGLKGDYLKASKRVPGFDPKIYGAPKGTTSLEGFLFPATYEVDVHGKVSGLVSEQLEAFHERLSGQYVAAARKLGLTPYGLVIVASMIEREAKLPKDRPQIAAVIYNRLRLGMPLGIDATIRYALNDWEKPLTESQLHIDSPYNTRLRKGLPPTPISNPGLESIEAAAHPAKVGYLYYVNGADGCGDLVFSNSYAEFEHDTALYEEALAANGGKEPKCKHQ